MQDCVTNLENRPERVEKKCRGGQPGSQAYGQEGIDIY
jgi:hypothetical protein